MSITKPMFETQLSIMKRVLKLGEFKFGKDTEQFKFFKEEVMNGFYDGTKKFFQQLVVDGRVEKCICQTNMRHGWTACEFCAGSGYREIPDYKTIAK